MKIQPTAYQQRVAEIPEQYNVLLAGGRAGGKSFGARLTALGHAERWGARARVLFVRESLAGLREVEDDLDALLRAAYGNAIKANRQDHLWRVPSGAVFECGYLDADADYNRYQGKNYSLIIIEEAGQFRSLRLVDKLRSCLRVPEVPCRIMLLGNPGGKCHPILHGRYIAGRVPWQPFVARDGEVWVWAPSTLRDNPHVDAAGYTKKLAASVGQDRALLKAWLDGDWNVLRGAMFADVLSESKNMLSAAVKFDLPDRRIFSHLGADWGQTRPAVCYAALRLLAPVDRFPRGSLILIDEVHSANVEEGWDVGLNWSPSRFADAIKDMADRNGVERSGVLDDARGLGSDETLITHMRSEGLHFTKPAKSRTQGWAALRELAYNSYHQNGRPGLWVSQYCEGFWAVAPSIPRDPIRPDDVDTSAVGDDFMDAARYCATHIPQFAVHTHRPLGSPGQNSYSPRRFRVGDNRHRLADGSYVSREQFTNQQGD